MPVTKIRGTTQILAGSITDAEISATANIATSKLAEGAEFLKRNGSIALTGNLNAGGNRITNLAMPTGANDAARLADVQAAVQGLSVKEEVRLATTGPVDLSTDLEAGDTIDGVVLVAGDRVLVKNQSSGAENGIYIASASGAAARSEDMNTSAETKPNSFVFVSEGTANQDTGWILTTNAPITLGTTALTFVQFSGPGSGVTSASNVGSVGVGVFKQLVNDNLEFYKIASADSKLTVSVISSDHIELAVIQSQIDHNSLLNYDINEHRTINDSGTASTDLWSAFKISSELALKRNTALQSGYIWVGNASNQSAPVQVSGDATLDNAGVLTLASNVLKEDRFVSRETPSGTVDGSNATFNLAFTPLAGTEHVYLNGVLQDVGAGNDYTITGSQIVFTSGAIPQSGDKVRVSYIKD